MLFCSAAKGQLVVDFTTDNRQGCAPMLVQAFTNLSTGTSPLTYSWDFGNGAAKSTQTNPGTTYSNPGSYTVKLVVQDAAGHKDSVIKVNFIVVNRSPLVDFTSSSTSGCVPFNVLFTDKSNAGSGTITSSKWDFGDGTTSSETSPSHTYNINGDFTITHIVTNSLGCVRVQTQAAFIHVNQLPKASFTSGSAASCNPPAVVSFFNTSLSPGGSIKSVLWKFGDGVTVTDQNPLHTYTKPGTYQVTLIVTNQNGCVDSITKPTVIGSVTPGFTGPDTVCQGAPANFLNTSTPAIASAFWEFGDNTTSSDINPVKKFESAGSFSVKLVNNFGACKDSITRKITVKPKPNANFSFVAPPVVCRLPVDVSFTATATGATSILWNFGDSTTSTSNSPTHTYAKFGSFSPKLTVFAANGCADSLVRDSIVSIVPAKIQNFTDLPFNGCVPHQQIFSANITSPEPVVSYLWNFGDGNTSTDATPSNNYAQEGVYDVFLKITTTNGCTDTFKLPAAIAIANRPTADFSADPPVSCAYQSVQFKNLSPGNITSTQWLFGDGASSEINDPLHHYTDTGFFSIKLIIGNRACFDTLVKKDYVYIKPPIANFIVEYNCETPLFRTFKNRSVLAQTNEWSFGDGSTSTDINPVHTYAAPGLYYVHLHVTNNDCYDDFTDTIHIIDEHPDFTFVGNMICRNTTTVFTATNVNPQNIATYTWNFADYSTMPTGRDSIISHNYYRAGLYSPELTVTDILGCSKTVGHPLSITIYGPIADFANPEGGCLSTSIHFTDHSRPTSNHPITRWILNYGDGNADTTAVTPAFTHTYASPKTYNVFLVATDSYGCSDTLLKPNTVTITKPQASFTVRDSISCDNATINFINQSSGLDLNYLWNFGDPMNETAENPSHVFTAEGNYTVSLAVKDRFGCTDTIKKVNGIVISNAKASFTLSDSAISCPPAQISFTNTSAYFTSVAWDFDDGNFSEIPSPSHYFLEARTYHIKLTAFGHGGCVDTVRKAITVKGPSGTFTYSPILKCVPSVINFTASATNNNGSFNWDFGDGTLETTQNSSISHTYTTPGQFLPMLLLTDPTLVCKVSVPGIDTITVTGALSYIKIPQSLFCDTATIQFFDSSIVKNENIASYTWTFGDGVTSNTQNPIHSYSAPGIYPVRLTVKTSGGCEDSSKNAFVKIVKSPQLVISGPAATCVNLPVRYTGAAEDTSQLKWKWDFNNGNSYVFPSPLPQTFTVAGTYSINTSVSNSSGCTSTKATVLTVNPLPNVDAGPDSVICRGATLTLHPSGADSYVWRNSPSLTCTTCASPTASPVDTSVYYLVTGTNALTSCIKTDSVQIKVVQPFKVAAMPFDTLCVGQSVKLWATGADRFTWSPATGLSNPNIPNPVANPGTNTLYTVTGHDYLNCFTDVASVPITVYPVPVFNIVDDNVTIAVGNSVTIKTKSSADITNWQWFPTTGLSCSSCAEPVSTPSSTIIYKASVTNAGGCRAEDRITINVFCNNGSVFIPNTFSPNNDGTNDVFFPRGKGVASVKNLQIFNRWGSIVFQKANFSLNDSRSGWDGTFNGKPVDADVFVYQIEVICETGQVFSFKGDITLIR